MPIDKEIFGDSAGAVNAQDDIFKDIAPVDRGRFDVEPSKKSSLKPPADNKFYSTNAGGAVVGMVKPKSNRVVVDDRPIDDPTRGGGELKIGPLDTGITISEGLTNTLAGAGRSFYETGRGIGQRIGLGPTREEIDATRKLDAPLLKTKEGALGNIFGSLAQLAPTMFIPGINTVTGSALLGGGLGLAQPVGKDDSILLNTGLSAGAASLLPAALWAAPRVRKVTSDMFQGEAQKRAVQLARLTGEPLDKVSSALNQGGPRLIPGSEPTVPQILQNPEISQVARTLKSSGQYALGEREALNSAAQAAALERVAPTVGTINEARDNLGNAIAKFAIPAEKSASKKVSALFESVPPQEAKMLLPIQQMEAAKTKYLPPGSFGKGNAPVDQAIASAKSIGQAKVTSGGVSDMDILSARNKGIISTIKNKFGLTDTQIQKGIVEGDKIQLDKILEGLTEGGGGYTQLAGKDTEYLRTLIQDEFSHLFDVRKSGLKINPALMHYPDDIGSIAAQMTKAEEVARFGSNPLVNKVVDKAVPFDQLQALRSSIGEQITQAKAFGNNQAAAALTAMKDAIDAKISATVIGPRMPGEVFTPNASSIYADALAAHSAKKARFNTGPQSNLFRLGSDGAPLREGAEIAPLFWNSGNGQREAVKSFRTLTENNPELLRLMKTNATTEALQQSAKGPNQTITYGAFDKWLKSHSGALDQLFSDSELATLRAINKDTRIAASAENLGRATGSNTYQNIFSNGMLDSKLLNATADNVPVLKYLTGPALNYIKGVSSEKRNAIMSELLANPEYMSKVLNDAVKRSRSLESFNSLLANSKARRVSPLLSQTPVYGGLLGNSSQ